MIEIVASAFREDLSWLNSLPDHTKTVYMKGVASNIPGSASIIQLPNKGREGHSFLTHIIDRYSTLSDFTVFVQGNPFDHCNAEVFHDLLKNPAVTRPLGGWLQCKADGAPNHPGIPLLEFSQRIDLPVSYPLSFCPGAQWLVRREDILVRPRSFYQQARDVLLTNELFGYCLERFWPVIFGYPSVVAPKPAPAWGLLYTHHQVPDAVLAQTLATIRAMGLPDERLVISCQREDDRLPVKARKVYFTPPDPYWIPAIYSQIIAGLEVLPENENVVTLEHDILYPMTYLDHMRQAMIDPEMAYYYVLVRHLDLRLDQQPGFWASDVAGTRTFQSCCGGRVGALLALARQDLLDYQKGKLNKDFELGMNGKWQRVDAEQPVLELRHGTNTSNVGYDRGIFHVTDYHPYWGYAAQLRSRLVG